MKHCKRCNRTGFSGDKEKVWSVWHSTYLLRDKFCLCITYPQAVKPEEW